MSHYHHLENIVKKHTLSKKVVKGCSSQMFHTARPQPDLLALGQLWPCQIARPERNKQEQQEQRERLCDLRGEKTFQVEPYKGLKVKKTT